MDGQREARPSLVLVPAAHLPSLRRRSYVAKDPVHGSISKEAWVTLLVRSPEYWSTIADNKAPVPQPARLSMTQAGVLVAELNATDDLDSKAQLIFSVSRPPSRGHVALDGPVFTYTPFPDTWGQDSFVFKVRGGDCDQEGGWKCLVS